MQSPPSAGSRLVPQCPARPRTASLGPVRSPAKRCGQPDSVRAGAETWTAHLLAWRAPFQGRFSVKGGSTRQARRGEKRPIHPLTCGLEPEVGFEPTTFRLRAGCSASTWTAPDGSGLLTLAASSVQTAPEGSRRIVWMIIGMLKAHASRNRMPRKRLGKAVAGPRATDPAGV